MLVKNTYKKVKNKNWITYVLTSLQTQMKLIKDKITKLTSLSILIIWDLMN
jgi:hypothetical protein